MIDAGGFTVRVRIEGDGAPVLLLSGLGQPLEAWDTFVAALGERRVVRFDAPGVGTSAPPTLPASVASLARIAEAVLDAADVDAADVVGYSLGGAVAQQLAHVAPARVRRLVLVATSCGLGSTSGRWDWRRVPRAPSGVAARDALALTWQATALASWTSIPFLGRLAQPTLVVCGRDDVVSPPANSRVLASRIPGARLVTLPVDHHVLAPGAASELARVAGEFFARVDAASGAGPVDGTRAATAATHIHT